MTLPPFLPLEPRHFPRVWGGQRLTAAQAGVPIGEAWLADGESRVAAGPLAGRTLDELLTHDPLALLGSANQTEFPLLVKLLDCQDWLSVQVHPNDAQAREMVGPGARGKTEAWYILEADAAAELIAGLAPGTTAEQLEAAILGGTVLEQVQRFRVSVGDTVYIPAGTLHALGPGLLLYEIQQASDTTYRVYDWDRPPSAGRALHLAESLAVTDAALRGDHRPAGRAEAGGPLVSCPYFELWHVETGPQDTAGTTPHLLTCITGQLTLRAAEYSMPLAQFETALIPAATGSYRVEGTGQGLLARLP